MADYYDLLGVSRDASDDEIKKAYRKMAHKYHPDKEGGDEAKFKEINTAYQALSNKEKRAQYDQFGQTFDGAGGPGAGAGGFDFSQFSRGGGGQGFEFNFGGGGSGFDDVFSQMFGGRGGRQQGERGRDIQVDVEITFAEMVTGVKKDVKLYKATQCATCSGSGGAPDAQEKSCDTCKGAGHITKNMQTIFGTIAQKVECSTCKGRGKTFDKPCSTCGGDGRVKETITESIDIPAGMQSGQTLSIPGKGEAGRHGAPAGDLFITVHVSEESRFTREGDNITSEAHVSFASAALGDTISVETVDGPVKMKVPAGTQSGEVYRIRDKGIPHLQSTGRGDHLVKVIVDIPTKLNKKQKKVIEELKALEK